MTPTSTQLSARRTAKTAAIGAAALTAVVALPAFALDRGGDGSVEAVTAAGNANADAVASTSTTLDPAVDAWLKQKALDDTLAWLATLTPEQQFQLLWSQATPEQQAQFEAYAAEQQAFHDFIEAQVAAEAARAQAAAKAAPRVSSGGSSSGGGGVWDRLAQCETGGNWSHPTVSGGFSGGLMFHSATWNAMGGQAYAPTAAGATREQQIDIAERVLASQGWGAWPGCSKKLGLR